MREIDKPATDVYFVTKGEDPYPGNKDPFPEEGRDEELETSKGDLKQYWAPLKTKGPRFNGAQCESGRGP